MEGYNPGRMKNKSRGGADRNQGEEKIFKLLFNIFI